MISCFIWRNRIIGRVAPEVIEGQGQVFRLCSACMNYRKNIRNFLLCGWLPEVWLSGGQTLRDNVDAAGVGLAVVASSATGGMTGGMEAVSQAAGAINAATNAAFDHYAEEQKLKRKSWKKQIKEVKEQYISYLSEFAPVYYKYMKEWDKLCLNKDKAYLDIYAGRAEDALNSAEAVLRQSPENREGLLLRSLCLIELGKLNREEGIQFRLPFDIERWKSIH